jgi:hypothetical protein
MTLLGTPEFAGLAAQLGGYGIAASGRIINS